MHAIGKSRGIKAAAMMCLAATLSLGVSGYAKAQTLQFNSEADSDRGTATQTTLGLLPYTYTWGPDDQSQSIASGNNSQFANSISENQSGVFVYQSTNDTNSTDAGASGDNQANASSSSGPGSALGGLVQWASSSIQLTCLPDSSITDQIDCTTYTTISNLSINGQFVAAGSFNTGATYSVTGNIPDTNCPLGVDSFSGNLVLDNSILNSGTAQGSDIEIGMQITGTATCKTAGLLPLYTTQYFQQIDGPEIDYKSVNLDTSYYIIEQYNDKLNYYND